MTFPLAIYMWLFIGWLFTLPYILVVQLYYFTLYIAFKKAITMSFNHFELNHTLLFYPLDTIDLVTYSNWFPANRVDEGSSEILFWVEPVLS